MDFETIKLDRGGGVARLTFNRPQRRNAFIVKMHQEMHLALDAATSDPATRLLTITGAGSAFCAGQDLAERDASTADIDLGANIEQYYNPLIRRLVSLPFPYLCAMNGVAAGAGVGIALAADLCIARRSARFVQAFAAIGLVPDAGSSWHLPRTVGMARAMGFTLLGESLSADRAADWGMIWRAVEDDQFDAEIHRVEQQLATGPTRGLVLAKQALRAALSQPLESQLEMERDGQRAAGRTRDYREGVTAFKEKRQAGFLGR